MRIKAIVFAIVFLLCSISFSRTLLLFKGSEKGYGENILKSLVVPVLEKLGESYSLKDTETDFEINFLDYDTIITCYYSSKMQNAKVYLKKLFDFLLNGGKLFIINNIGAALDENGNNPDLSHLNSIYNLLGFYYKYSWRKEKIKSVNVDNEYLLKQPIMDNERGIETFEIFSPKVKIIEEIETDTGRYPTVFLGEKGGMILYDYAFSDDESLFLDIGKIVEELLCRRGSLENKVLIIGYSQDVRKTFENSLFEIENKNNIDSIDSFECENFKAIILIDDASPTANSKIRKYLENGGTVIWIGNGSKEIYGEIVFKSDFLMIPKDIVFDKRTVKFQQAPKGSKVIIQVNDTVVSWISKVGKGNIFFFPRSLLGKVTRGILMNGLLLASNSIICPIVNSYSVFLDDFPLPSYNSVKEEIIKEFGNIDTSQFYYQVWWKDLKELSRELNLKYTAALVTTYNSSKSFPNDFSDFLISDLPLSYLEMLLKSSEIEIGIHGYNHLSPIKDNWTKEDLVKSYKTLKIFVENIAENYKPLSFVAPNNKIDDMGFEALRSVFPSIKLIGTAYSGNDEYSEFGVKNGVVILPRTTSGYYPIEKLILSSISAVLNMGTFQYFVHPDDLFSNDRNPEKLSWKDMKKNFKEFIETIQRYYPWLRNNYSYEAGVIFRDYFTKRPDIRYSQDRIEIIVEPETRLPRYFFLKTNKNFNIIGGKIIYNYKNNVYVVEMFETPMIIQEYD